MRKREISDGSKYIATVELTSKAGEVLAAPGQACDRVPGSSLSWLLAQGLIAPAPIDDPAPAESGE